MRIPVCESKREQHNETSQPPRPHKTNEGSPGARPLYQVSSKSASPPALATTARLESEEGRMIRRARQAASSPPLRGRDREGGASAPTSKSVAHHPPPGNASRCRPPLQGGR